MSTYTNRLRNRLSRMLPEKSLQVQYEHAPASKFLASARGSFLHGYQKALDSSSSSLSTLLNHLPSERLGFALEGAALAMVMLDELGDSGEHLSHLLAGRSVVEQTLCAIGAGWASARLRRPLSWLPKGLDSKYRSAVTDGYGFHQGFFNSHHFNCGGFQVQSIDVSEFFDIGLGRALWFTKLGRVQAIAQVIDDLPIARKIRFWQGVGVACAFSSNRVQEPVLTCFAKGFETHLSMGLDTGTQLLHTLALSKKRKNL